MQNSRRQVVLRVRVLVRAAGVLRNPRYTPAQEHTLSLQQLSTCERICDRETGGCRIKSQISTYSRILEQNSLINPLEQIRYFLGAGAWGRTYTAAAGGAAASILVKNPGLSG